MASDQLRITEIFNSLQGETRSVGLPTVFVRLTGCPLRCVYCDTAYAFSGGEQMNLESIIADVQQYASRHVTVTGGEAAVVGAIMGVEGKTLAVDDGERAQRLTDARKQQVKGSPPRTGPIFDLQLPLFQTLLKSRILLKEPVERYSAMPWSATLGPPLPGRYGVRLTNPVMISKA